jgi:DNA polymerase-3 subunit gamma/tau
MPDPPASAGLADSAAVSGRPAQYVVVARRYRPQTFDDLVGQQHVAQALSNAITTSRVGHAYLFTGARGVGKTSAARIFAKAINCVKGPTPTPCNECDICRSISTGEDMDVLEIDGASNRGIDEIRQLRQNAGVRPSRARSKIYIIDEVHMLTREAFNALLKTLEEPPEHVKFIFCTTEPTKIPVTILSRCQRFDFAGILWSSIAERLTQIAAAEGVSAEPEALQVLARRATGSMRDAQSLLEQLLAFAPEKVTVADVHAMLGSAGEERLASLVDHLVRRDAPAALAELDAAVHQGVDVGQLVEQLFGYFRDAMAAVVGCPGEAFLYASPAKQDEVAEAGRQLGLETILAAMQILDQTLSRLRYSTQARLLAELALVRIASLEDLDDLATLIAQLEQGGAAAGGPAPRAAAAPARTAASGPARPREREKKTEPALASPPEEPEPPPSRHAAVALCEENAIELWSQACEKIPGLAGQQAKHFDRVAILAPNHLEVHFKPAYTLAKSVCERPDQLARFEQALAELTGERVRVEFSVAEDEPAEDQQATSPRPVSLQQRLLEITKHPMIHRAGELFDAHPLRVDEPPADK